MTERIDDQVRKDEKKLVKDVIVNVLSEYNIRFKKIVLFGSRARGDARRDSDWDLMVVIEDEVPRNVARELKAILRMRLARYRISSDIILKTSESVERERSDPGRIAHYAMKEGIEL